MDETKINFGDKLFLHGSFLQFLPEDGEFQYNAVKGSMAINNIAVIDVNADQGEIAGFIVDFLSIDSLAFGTAFSRLVDVTESLTRQVPSPSGTKVWMPIAPDVSRF